MKRLLITLMLSIAAIAAVQAQKGMHIAEIFDGGYRKLPNVTEVVVKGKQLKSYNLSVFRSMTVSNSPSIAAKMESLVKADGKSAIDKETGMKGGRLYYAFYSFRQANGSYHYLFFRNNLLRKGAKPETTVVYMEGSATLEELKRMFN